MYLTLLTTRIETVTEKSNLLGNIQFGFRKGKRIEECILLVQHIAKKVTLDKRNYNSAAIALLDITKAYDRVCRDALWYKMGQYGYATKLITAIQASYDGVGAVLSFQSAETKTLQMPVGLRQGCSMSPILFAIFLADLGREIEQSKCGIMVGQEYNQKCISGIFFADDMLLIGKSEHNLQKLLVMVSEYAQQWKLEFSGPKSSVIPLQRIINKDKKWSLGHKYISEINIQEINMGEKEEGKYLGVVLGQHNKDILHRHKKNMTEILKQCSRMAYEPAAATARQVLYGTKIWTTYSVSRVLHGIAGIRYTKETFRPLEIIQNEFIRKISKLPLFTATAALYGETGLMPIRYEADKRTLSFYFYVRQLPDNAWASLVLQEQQEWLHAWKPKQFWLQHVQDMAQRYGIDMYKNKTKNQVKLIVHNHWLAEYVTMVETKSTLKNYDKKIPRANPKVNITYGGAYWLKAKCGALMLNDRSHKHCTRCDNEQLEDINHLLWGCKSNLQEDSLKGKLLAIWKAIPPDINVAGKPFWEIDKDIQDKATNWILSDIADGISIQQTGRMIETLWKLRPETVAYFTNTDNSGPKRNKGIKPKTKRSHDTVK